LAAADEAQPSSCLRSLVLSLLTRSRRSPQDNQCQPTKHHKESNPSWFARLYAGIMVRAELVESPTMDLPMQMPPPGWEDEIEPPREPELTISNCDELWLKAMKRMNSSVGAPPQREKRKRAKRRPRKTVAIEEGVQDTPVEDIVEVPVEVEEPDGGSCSAREPPTSYMVSRSSGTLTDILAYYMTSEDSDDYSADNDTPMLSPASDSSDSESSESTPCTPLSAVTCLFPNNKPAVEASTGLGINIVEQDELPLEDIEEAQDAVKPVRDREGTPEVEETNAVVSVVVGHTPLKLVLDYDTPTASPQQMSQVKGEVEDRVLSVIRCSPSRSKSLISDVQSTPTKSILEDGAMVKSPNRMLLVEDDAMIPTITGCTSTDSRSSTPAIAHCAPLSLPFCAKSPPEIPVQTVCLDGEPSHSTDDRISCDSRSPHNSSATTGGVTLNCKENPEYIDSRTAALSTHMSLKRTTSSNGRNLFKAISGRRRSLPLISESSPKTATKPSKAQLPPQLPNAQAGISLPRPRSAPVLSLLARSASRRLATPSSLPSAVHRMSRAASLQVVSLASHSSVSRAATAHGSASVESPSTRIVTDPRPCYSATTSCSPSVAHSSRSTRKPSTTPSRLTTTPPRHTSLQAAAFSLSSRKIQVSFEPTSTPSPRTRAVWRSFSRQPAQASTSSRRPTQSWKP
jgi:hypothetical protein